MSSSNQGAATVAVDLPGAAVAGALTAVGAVAMIASGLFTWVNPIPASFLGTQIGIDIFYRASPSIEWPIYASAAIVGAILGSLALAGLATRSPKLTQVAGGLGILAFGCLLFSVLRSAYGLGFSDIGVGAWLLLVGSFVTLAAGFIAPRSPRRIRG